MQPAAAHTALLQPPVPKQRADEPLLQHVPTLEVGAEPQEAVGSEQALEIQFCKCRFPAAEVGPADVHFGSFLSCA